MAKQIKTIQQFDGGFVDFSDGRDIQDKEAIEAKNVSVRNVGRISLLGQSSANTDIDTLGNNVGMSSNDTFFTFSTDININAATGGEDWIAFVDKTSSNLYLHNISTETPTWTNVDVDTFIGIEGSVYYNASGSSLNNDCGYYFVDGILRVCNTETIKTLAPSITNGCDSLWVGYINKAFLSGSGTHAITADHLGCYPAELISPYVPVDVGGGAYDEGTFARMLNFESAPSGIITISAVNPSENVGMFHLNATIERGKGDGTLKLQGRKIYASFTFDGVQETLPTYIDMIKSTDLPAALTSSELGYEVNTVAVIEYGAGAIVLERDVRVEDESNSNYLIWDNSGTVRVIDQNNTTQTLTYGSIEDNMYNITSIEGDATTVTVETEHDHHLAVDDVVAITATGYDITEATVVTASGNNFTYSDTSNAADPASGTVTTTRCQLTGVIGWVDSGYCSITESLGVVEDIGVAAVGSGYTGANGDTYTYSDAITISGNSGFEATVELDDGMVNKVTVISSGGIGYETTPEVSLNSSTITSGSGAELSAVMSGYLNTESFCTQNNGSWNAGDISSGTAVIFDPPGELEERDENLGIQFTLGCLPYDATHIISPESGGNRITHVNLYTNKYEDDTGTIPEMEDFAYITSFDLINGHKNKDGTFQEWLDTTDTTNTYTFSNFFGSMFSDNYQGRTGLFPDTQSLKCRWETATVLNRIVYAGNVIMYDKGSLKKFPDRVLKSVPNCFDTFAEYDTLDVVVDDGDDIVLLENYGGKLLQFKKETLYVIDVTSQPEFLAGSFKYRGIPNKAAAKKTDFGVVFANNYGAFLFNGADIKQLVQGKIEAYWDSWYSDDVAVTFDPFRNYAIFKKSGSSDFLLHDFLTSSWVKGDGVRMQNGTTSDWFINNGEMTYMNYAVDGGTSSIAPYSWSDTCEVVDGTDNCIWVSKEFSFDTPLTDTRIHNIKITYKAQSTANMKAVLIYQDGDAETTVDLGSFGSSAEWQTQQFNISPSVTCKTARIKIEQYNGALPNKGFEINDIAFIFRSKRIK